MDISELINRCTGFEWDKGNFAKIWQRYTVFGQTNAGRKPTVVFTIRGESIRVISARDMNRRERKACAK